MNSESKAICVCGRMQQDGSIEADGLTGGFPVDASVVATALTIHVKL